MAHSTLIWLNGFFHITSYCFLQLKSSKLNQLRLCDYFRTLLSIPCQSLSFDFNSYFGSSNTNIIQPFSVSWRTENQRFTNTTFLKLYCILLQFEILKLLPCQELGRAKILPSCNIILRPIFLQGQKLIKILSHWLMEYDD